MEWIQLEGMFGSSTRIKKASRCMYLDSRRISMWNLSVLQEMGQSIRPISTLRSRVSSCGTRTLIPTVGQRRPTGRNHPYLKTNAIVVDETMLAVIDKIMIVKSSSASHTGTLTNSVIIDGTTKQFADQSKEKTNLIQKLLTTNKRACRKVQVEYNLDAAGEAYSAARIRLDEIVIYGRLTVPRNLSA